MRRLIILLIVIIPILAYSNSVNNIGDGDKKIAKIYKKKCSKCHGKSGEGVKNKKKKPPINHLGKMDNKKLFKIIRDGYKGKNGRMPALKKKYANDKEVEALVKFVKAMDKKSKKKTKK